MLKIAGWRRLPTRRVWRVIALLSSALGIIVFGSETLGPWAQRQIGMGHDANRAEPHVTVGTVWFDQRKQDDPAAEYGEAIRFDPNNTDLSRGIVWHIPGKQGYAAVEYREAIHLDPQLATAYYSLGLALGRLANSSSDAPDRARRLRDACGAFMQGASLAPIGPGFPARMRDINVLLHGAGHCPSE